MHSKGKGKRKRVHLYWAGTIILLLSAALILFAYRLFMSEPADDRFMAADLSRLSNEQYDSVFLSMHPIQNYSEKDFLQMRGVKTVIGAHAILDPKELTQYFECIFASDNMISNIFLCLDPYLFQDIKTDSAESLYEGLYTYMDAYPDVTFDIILPYPSLDYWLEKKDEEISTILTTYRTFVEETAGYSNAVTYFLGHEDWLIGNPANYENAPFDTNSVISQKIMMYTFCDRMYQINTDNASALINSLSELIAREKPAPTDYPGDIYQRH